MKSRTTRQFRDRFKSLPKIVQRQARDAYQVFLQNPTHPSLHFKKIHASGTTYSARVGIRYRAVCTFDRDTAVWFWIGPHADYDQLIRGL
jgi:mRNA-degrading endonuclease RelE of RelBE toxin-antitoxin system